MHTHTHIYTPTQGLRIATDCELSLSFPTGRKKRQDDQNDLLPSRVLGDIRRLRGVFRYGDHSVCVCVCVCLYSKCLVTNGPQLMLHILSPLQITMDLISASLRMTRKNSAVVTMTRMGGIVTQIVCVPRLVSAGMGEPCRWRIR